MRGPGLSCTGPSEHPASCPCTGCWQLQRRVRIPPGERHGQQTNEHSLWAQLLYSGYYHFVKGVRETEVELGPVEVSFWAKPVPADPSQAAVAWAGQCRGWAAHEQLIVAVGGKAAMLMVQRVATAQ